MMNVYCNEDVATARSLGVTRLPVEMGDLHRVPSHSDIDPIDGHRATQLGFRQLSGQVSGPLAVWE